MAWIPIVIVVALVGVLVFRLAQDLRRLREAKRWSRTTGHVVGWCPPSRDPRGELRVVYEYRVGGMLFRSDRICAGIEHRRGARARHRGRLYLEHSRVLVNYDPQNPRRACVEISSDPDHLTLAVALASALLALLVLV